MGKHIVYFATNRMPKGNPPVDFVNEPGPVDGRNLRYGIAEVSVAGVSEEDGDKIDRLHVSKEQLFVGDDGSHPKRGSDEVLEQIYQRMKNDGGRDCLVVVHGFWNSFESSILGAARFAEASEIDANLFAFCWPSHDDKFRYHDDRKRAEESGTAMARAFLRTYNFVRELDHQQRCHRDIHILAHSMGNYALRAAVQEARRKVGDRLPPLFGHVLLVAADEDADALECAEKLKPLARICRDITVYHTPLDLALEWSREVKGNMHRLGTLGPANLYAIDRNVFAVDVTDAVRDDGGSSDHLVDHYFHRVNPVCVDDMVRVLTDQPRPNRRPTDHPQASLLKKPVTGRGTRSGARGGR